MMPISVYRIERPSLGAAANHLGLKLDVRVAISGRLGCAGRYVGVKHDVHVIALSAYLSVRDANFTVWHELGHALQAELYGPETQDRVWMDDLHAAGLTLARCSSGLTPEEARRYNSLPLEVHANAVASLAPIGITPAIPRSKGLLS